MEEKLAEFRQRNGQKKTSRQWREIFAGLTLRSPFSRSASSQATAHEPKHTDEDETEEEETEVVPVTSWQVFVMKMLVWLTLLVIFVRLEFAMIYLILSLLYLIWSNLGAGRRRGQLSAYSVFNPNLEKIQGTFSGEDYDRQLRHGGGAPLSF